MMVINDGYMDLSIIYIYMIRFTCWYLIYFLYLGKSENVMAQQWKGLEFMNRESLRRMAKEWRIADPNPRLSIASNSTSRELYKIQQNRLRYLKMMIKTIERLEFQNVHFQPRSQPSLFARPTGWRPNIWIRRSTTPWRCPWNPTQFGHFWDSTLVGPKKYATRRLDP